MTTTAPYPRIIMIPNMATQNLMTSVFGDHLGQQWVRGNQYIAARQDLESESLQLR